MENSKDPIETLFEQAQKVQRQPVPTDLFQQIQSKLDRKPVKQIKTQWLVGMAASFLVLVSLNLIELKESTGQKANEVEFISQELEPTNTLY